MRKITLAVRQTMDGVIQDPNTPSDHFKEGWSPAFWDEKATEVYDSIFGAPFDLLLGRKTYDVFANYWPNHKVGFVIAEGIAKANKYVITHREDAFSWENTFRLREINDIKKLKASEGRDLLIQGSASLYAPLLAERLIDKICLLTFPVILGGGQHLFELGTPISAFRLINCEVSATGIIIANYEPAGEALKRPSE